MQEWRKKKHTGRPMKPGYTQTVKMREGKDPAGAVSRRESWFHNEGAHTVEGQQKKKFKENQKGAGSDGITNPCYKTAGGTTTLQERHSDGLD